MRFNELKKSLDGGEKYSAYLVEGEDGYFRSRAVELLKTAFVTEPYLNAATFDGETVAGGEVIASLTSIPILSENRMTVIKEFYPKADALKGGLSDFLENPVKGSVLVIVNEKTSETLKKFKSVCVVSCGAADTALISRWIKATAQNAGVTVSVYVCEKIAEYCLSDMTRVKNETEKLIAYAGANGEITEDAVELLVYRDAEYKIYEMTDYIAKRKFDLAISVINDMLDKGETSGRILSSVYNYFRRILFAAIGGKSDAELASLLGIKEFAVKKTREQAAAFKIRALKKTVDRLGDADLAIKSGKVSADDVMWLNLFEIMTA